MRRRRDTPPAGQIVRRGLVVWILVGACVLFGVLVVNGVPGRNYLNVKVDVPQTGNLLAHDPVRIGGARVGQVSARDLGPDGRPRLSLQLEPGLRISRDTKVRIRANGLLGARYVELVPGKSPATLGEGDVIHAPERALTYGVPDALDTFDKETRGALGNVITQAGTGVLTNGRPLNEAIRRGSEQIVPFRRIVGDVFARPGALARLVPSLDATTTALSDNRRDLSLLPGAISSAFGPLASERAALRDTIALAPSTLAETQSGLEQGTRLVTALRDLTGKVNTTLPGAPAALRETARLLERSRRPLVTARGLVDQVPSAVPALLRVTKRLSPVLPHAESTFAPLLPMLDEVARHGCDITNFAAGFRSMTGIGGEGSGPNGSAGEFRLQLVFPAGSEATGVDGPSGAPLRREGYPEPCKYTNVTYETFPGLSQHAPTAGRKGRGGR